MRAPSAFPRKYLIASTFFGFSLVEVVLAIGIMSFGLITVFALLPTGLVSVREGKMEEAASDILGLAATDLRATPKTNTTSSLFTIETYADNPSAVTNYLSVDGASVSADQADFRLVAAPRPIANDKARRVWHLTVEWPPQAAKPDNRVETLVFLRQ